MKSPASIPQPQSEFGAFLFAEICDEQNGMPLSVVSALTRLGVDPWKEAARLAALPSRTAAEALAAMIERIAGAAGQRPDAAKIAAGLIELLPRGGSARDSAPRAANGPNNSRRIVVWQVYVILFLAAALIYAFITN